MIRIKIRQVVLVPQSEFPVLFPQIFLKEKTISFEGGVIAIQNISSVAFWYQTEPHAKFPKLPSKDELEII